jgi:hypothetical protein
MNHVVRRVFAAGAAALVVAVAGGHASASATAQYAPDTFRICVDQACTMETKGTITWSNRMATIEGEVINRVSGTALGNFGVFAGENYIEGMVIKSTVPAGSSTDVVTKFGPATLGNPDLAGGVNIVKIKVCSSFTRCSAEHSYVRD